MLIAIILIGAVALGLPFAFANSPIKTTPVASAKIDRRLKWVERHPGEVNTGDIERLLSTDGLCLGDVRKVSDTAFSMGVKPFTMWTWIQTYGARELAIAVAAEVSHDELLECLAEGKTPNFEELEVFAALNGLVAASESPGKGTRTFADRSIRKQPSLSRDQIQHRKLEDLDIHEPGDWEFSAEKLSSFEVFSDEPEDDWDFGGERGVA